LDLSFVRELFFLLPRSPEKIMETPEGLSAVSFVLAEAVGHRTERVDTPTAQMFLSQRSAPADGRDIMKTLSLFDQLALVAIFEAGKKLVSCLRNFVIAGMSRAFGISAIQGRTIENNFSLARQMR
jgi:hypothetical protein